MQAGRALFLHRGHSSCVRRKLEPAPGVRNHTHTQQPRPAAAEKSVLFRSQPAEIASNPIRCALETVAESERLAGIVMAAGIRDQFTCGAAPTPPCLPPPLFSSAEDVKQARAYLGNEISLSLSRTPSHLYPSPLELLVVVVSYRPLERTFVAGAMRKLAPPSSSLSLGVCQHNSKSAS